MPIARPYSLENLRKYLKITKSQLLMSNKYVSQAVYQTLQTTKIWTLKNCQGKNSLNPQLQPNLKFFKFPPMPPFLFAVFFGIPSFNVILSSYFNGSLNLVAVSTVWILIKNWKNIVTVADVFFFLGRRRKLFVFSANPVRLCKCCVYRIKTASLIVALWWGLERV